MRSIALHLVGVLLLLCTSPSTATAQSTTALVRVVHATSGVDAIDVFLDGVALVSNRAYGTISDYGSVSAGRHQLAIAPSGKGADNAVTTLAVTIVADQAYTVAAVGPQNVTVQVFTDDLSPIAQDVARIRVIHGVPDAPAANVEVVGGPTLLENVAFPNASKYVEVVPGSYNLQAVVFGDNNVFLNLPNTAVEGGKVYDVVLSGRLANIDVAVAAVMPPMVRSAQPQQARQNLPTTGMTSNGMLLWVGLLVLASGAILTRRSFVSE